MRLHLLTAESASHPQALHRDLGVVLAQDMGADPPRPGRVLGAGLTKALTRLVDVGQGAMGLQVEVLLSGELERAGEHVAGGAQALIDVPALYGGLCTLALSGLD